MKSRCWGSRASMRAMPPPLSARRKTSSKLSLTVCSTKSPPSSVPGKRFQDSPSGKGISAAAFTGTMVRVT